MAKPAPKIPQSELAGRLQAFMLLRVIFVSLLLGASIFIQIKENQTYFGYIQTFHYLLIVFVYFLTFVYVIILKWSKNLLWFAYLQLLVDTLFVTAIIFSTGGIESIFSFLYILTIINASIILYRKGGFIISSCSSILYGLLLAFHYYNIIKPLGSRGTYGAEYQSFHLFYLILVNIAAFYLVAYLSSFLGEQVKKGRVELDAKQIDIDKLEVLNESIINSISSGLIALDDHNCIILFNPAAEDFFETRATHVFGRQIEQAFPFLTEYLSDIGFSSIEKDEKNPSFIDIPYLKRNNKNIFLRFSLAPLRFLLGEQKGHILIFNDITEIREIEEAIKKVEGLAMIGELAAGMAHEIRNPMASISGSIQMLKDGLEQDNINSRLMDIISREINRLNNLVNDFLLFARPRKTNWKEFDLNSLIFESLELFQNSRNRNEQIKYITDFFNSIRMTSDPEQIKQVLWNLFLNACEAMPAGGTLSILTKMEPVQSEPDKQIVRIVVRDTGNGFDKKSMSQLFIPFFTTKEGGSGLGLAIVKRIVESLKGSIYGRNHPEGGAEIDLSLPVSFDS